MKKIYFGNMIILLLVFALVGYVSAGQNDRFSTLELTDVTATAAEINKLDGLSGDVLTTSSTSTLTNKTLTSPVINTGVSGTAVLDSDTMAGASATTISSSESIKAYVDNFLIGADDGLTVDDDGNVAGLASVLLLANSVRTTLDVHYADVTEHTSGAQTAIAAATATDLTSAITLITEMLTSYAAHDDDAILAAAWAYHVAQGTEKALASVAAPTTLAECITRANDLKAKINDHMDDATAHADGDTAQIATADAAMGAAVDVTLSGATSGDAVVWSILNDGTGNVTGVSAVAGTDKVTFTFSADPQADTIISYLVLRL